jgi:hypothetical protein
MTVGWLGDQNIGSKQKLSVLTGDPNTWLFIYSGFANVEQKDWAALWSGGHSSSPTVNIKLDNLAGVLLEYACTGSLANITGGDVGQWAVTADSLTLEENGDLVLSTSLYVYADDSNWEELVAYSYYVSAKILLETAMISGTVRWRKTLAQPASPPLFAVTANSEIPPSSPGSFGTVQVEATGVAGSLDSSDPTYYYVPYTITGALLGKTVFVSVAPIPAKFTGVPATGSLTAQQISGPTQITITNSNLHVSNVDFELTFEPGAQ